MHCYLLLFTVMKLERKLERNIEQVKPEVLSIIKRFSRYKWGRMTVETEYTYEYAYQQNTFWGHGVH